MATQNRTKKPRYAVVYQAWAEDERPAVALTPIGSIMADQQFAVDLIRVSPWWLAPETFNQGEN